MAMAPRWYVDAKPYSAVFAVGDLHGDAGAAIAVFRDVIGAVRNVNNDLGSTEWKWMRRNIAVVVLGDVVDRSRSPGASASGENDIQQKDPDDLFLLRLLNAWAVLAESSASKLIRLVGNHEVLQCHLQYSTANDVKLLDDRYTECENSEPLCNRLRSFQNGSYFDEIWNRKGPEPARVFVQIGPWLFVHGGLTPDAVDYATKPDCDAEDDARNMMRDCSYPAPVGLTDLLQSRDLNYLHRCDAGNRAQTLLRQWNDNVKANKTTVPVLQAVVIGHSLQTPDALVTSSDTNRLRSRPHSGVRVPSFELKDRHRESPSAVAVYAGWRRPVVTPDWERPWINASLNSKQQPTVYRVDVGLSRCWERGRHGFRPQVLCLDPAQRDPATAATVFFRVDDKSPGSPPVAKRSFIRNGNGNRNRNQNQNRNRRRQDR